MVLKSELRKTQDDVRLWSGAMDGDWLGEFLRMIC